MVFDNVANSINNLPIMRNTSSKSGVKADVGFMDLFMPNCLKFGWNNNIAPVGIVTLTNDPRKHLDLPSEIFYVWWKNWLDIAIPKLMNKTQGEQSYWNLEVEDIILMKRQENDISDSYKFCIIDAIEKSDEDQVRKVVVHYHNIEEKTDRFTRRSVSSLILIRKYE